MSISRISRSVRKARKCWADYLALKTPRWILRDLALSAVFLVAFGWWFLFSGHVFHAHRSNAPQRNAILRLHEEINLGAFPVEVENAFRLYGTPKLAMLTNETSAWRVRMPMEFGAGDWWLIIEFCHGQVSAMRVRTSDGPPPKDGPADKEVGNPNGPAGGGARGTIAGDGAGATMAWATRGQGAALPLSFACFLSSIRFRRNLFRVSEFGFLSDFGLRFSDFKTLLP